MDSPHDILILRFSSLGDVVLSTVLLDAIAHCEPQARVTWVTKRAYASLFERDPRVHRLVALAEGESVGRLHRRLAEWDFDLVLDAHASLRSRVLTMRMPPTELRRLDKLVFDRWLHLGFGVHRPGLDRRQIDRFLDLLPDAPRDLRPRVILPNRENESSASVPTLAVAPGARHPAKAWPLERFAEAALRWSRSCGGRVRILGSEGEHARRLATWLDSEGDVEILDGSGPRDLLDLARDLADSDRLLCNDSGLLHLAEAVGTPVVSLFGPTTRAWGYFPLDPRSRVIETELACRPCSRNGGRPCRLQHRLCMELLSVQEVTEALGTPADLEAAS